MIEDRTFPRTTSVSTYGTDFYRQNDSFTATESGFSPDVEKNFGLRGNNLCHGDFRRDDYIKTSVSPNVEENFGIRGSVCHNHLRSGIYADDYMERRISPVEEGHNDLDILRGIYADDYFIMYVFKIKNCRHVKPHDWTKCPYAHPGESARRRDPRKYPYFGTTCPGFRKGKCKKGDNCENAHGVFEYWLHPTNYRTQPCKDGRTCNRDVCFFAHTAEQLRVLPSYPNDYNNKSCQQFFENSILPRSNPNPMDEIISSLQQLQMAKSMPLSGEMQTRILQLAKSMPSSQGMQRSNFGGSLNLPTGQYALCSVPDGLPRMQMGMGNDMMQPGMVFDKLRKDNCLDIAGLDADQDDLRVLPSYPNDYNKSCRQFSENSILPRSNPNPMDEIISTLQQLQLAKSMPLSWETQTSILQLPKSMPSSQGMQRSNFGGSLNLPTGQHALCSVPDGLPRMQMGMGNDIMQSGMVCDKLRKDNCSGIAGLDADPDDLANQDFGWVSDLVNSGGK